MTDILDSTPITHERTITMSEEVLTIDDYLTGKYKTAVAYFHLHPHIQIELETPSKARIITPNKDILFMDSSLPMSRECSTWHPSFGIELKTFSIKIPLKENKLSMRIRIIDEKK